MLNVTRFKCRSNEKLLKNDEQENPPVLVITCMYLRI